MDLVARYHALCTPAQVYVVLHLAGMVLKTLGGDVLGGLVGGGIMLFLGAWFLNYLCRKNLRWLSWILAIGLPTVVLVLVVAGAWAIYEADKKDRRHGRRNGKKK